MASWNCVTRDVTVHENITLGSIRKFCDYHGLCYHNTKESNSYQACRKHVQLTHRFTEQQRLWQDQFVKDVKRHAKKQRLCGKEVKDLSTSVKDKNNETIKQHTHNMHAMNNFKDLSISLSNESFQSIISNTSVEGTDDKSCKPASKK
eukprot:2586407-Ditylum_brightwellii.AAC.1